jgi:hypothetical protein
MPLLHNLNPDVTSLGFYTRCMKCTTVVTDLDMLNTQIIDVITTVTRAKLQKALWKLVESSQFTKKIQQDVTVYKNFISYLCKTQHVSGDTPPIIRSLKLH